MILQAWKFPIPIQPLLYLITLLIFIIVTVNTLHQPTQNLTRELLDLKQKHNLMGISLQITKDKQIIYNTGIGSRDNLHPITNDTIFDVASLSKSVTASAMMLLVEQNKLRLNQPVSEILGLEFRNPNFPSAQITVQMVLSHQSSLYQCQPYYSNFLQATHDAQNGSAIPHIKQILSPDGKFYNPCLYSNKYQPGKHFQYVNLHYSIIGTIIQKITGIRFDIFLRENILKYISEGLSEIATFNIETIRNPDNLGASFIGEQGKWVPIFDYYPDGNIPKRNLNGYEIGTNGAIFSPQGGMRASVSHLNNFMYVLANGGVTKEGKTILHSSSVNQILKPRYQYHGPNSGLYTTWHQYGFGIYTTTYHKNDQIIPHEVVSGHIGSDVDLISAFYFWKNYAFSFIINGALYGYDQNTDTIYERERMIIHEAVGKFVGVFG